MLTRSQGRCSLLLRVLKRSCYRGFASNTEVESSADGMKSLVRCFQSGKAQRLVAMVGAGISTLSGLPDFRSPGTGLYDNLQQYRIPYPEAIFDIQYFHHDPLPFFALTKELFPSTKYTPNIVHYFLRMLHEKGHLLRLYTQNIDGLERVAGFPAGKLVEAHGTFATATCVKCHRRYAGAMVKKAVSQDAVPHCLQDSCRGVVKPDIVFFGENLPASFWRHKEDMAVADLLLIIGTSLEVYPFAGIMEHTGQEVPRVLMNREPVGAFRQGRLRPNDAMITGDLRETVQKFCSLMRWDSELQTLMNNAAVDEKASLVQVYNNNILNAKAIKLVFYKITFSVLFRS